MIPTTDRRQLAVTGSRLRGGHLVEQANYTLELARQSAEVTALLPRGFLDEVVKAVRQVEKGMRDHATAFAEAREASRAQNDTLRQVREWRRRLAALGRAARRKGANIPEPLTTIGAMGRSVPSALGSLHEAIGLLKENAAQFEPFPLYPLVLREAESLAVSLAAVDSNQEMKLLSDRPDVVRRYYIAKATLYQGLKIINDMARAAYAGDPTIAARFNLAILNRATGRSRSPAKPAPPQA